MTDRREFSVAAQIAIVTRASDGQWRIHCERCGRWCPKRKDYEIDHVVPEGMRPAADKARKLTAADGQLLCLDCHSRKTKTDKAAIGLAVRAQAYAMGIEKPGKKRMRSRPREEKAPYEPAAGRSEIARRYCS